MAVDQGTMPVDLTRDIQDEKDTTGRVSPDLEADQASSHRHGHRIIRIGGRIAPVLPHLNGYGASSDDSASDLLGQQIKNEENNSIKYRTCSWYKVEFHSSRLSGVYFVALCDPHVRRKDSS